MRKRKKGKREVAAAALFVFLFITPLAGCRITTPIVSQDNSYEEGEKDGANEGGEASVNEGGGKGSDTKVDEAKAGDGNATGSLAALSGAVPVTRSDEESAHIKERRIKGYRIGPGDVLHVSVWNNEELTMDVMVRPDGKISLPLLQDVSASGFTAEELRDIIAVRLKEFIIEPIVTITVKEVNYPKFFMMGEIKNPGTYPLREKLTILQAISLAGGFTEFASTSNIILIRQKNPYQQKIRIDYGELLKSGAEDKNIYLEPGDTIIIP